MGRGPGTTRAGEPQPGHTGHQRVAPPTARPRLAWTLPFALAGGCFQPAISADDLRGADPETGTTGIETGGTEDSDGGSTGGDTAGLGTGTTGDDTGPVGSDTQACTCDEVTFTVRTTAPGGKYQPRNVGAIWIEDGDGGFVKTLSRWGTLRARWLSRWNDASDGDVTDAITGATLSSHETHAVTWDLTDTQGDRIGDGEYSVVIELTDKSGPGPSLDVPFTVGDEPLMVDPEGAAHFHDMRLVFE